MIELKDTADDREGVAEWLHKQTNEKVDHKVQDIGALAEEADRLFGDN